MNNRELQENIEKYCERFPDFADRFRSAVINGDLRAASRIFECTAGSLHRQLQYATQIVVYGPSTASQYRHHSCIVRGYTAQSSNALDGAYRAGRAVVMHLKYHRSKSQVAPT